MAFASYTFNGTDEVLERTISSSAPNNTVFTASVWMKTSVTNGVTLIESRNGTTNRTQFICGAAEDLQAAATLASVVQWTQLTTAGDVSVDGTWHHYVCQYDSTQGVSDDIIRIYKDGTLLTDTGTDPTASEVHNLFENGRIFYVGALPTTFKAQKLAFIEVLEGVLANPTDFAFSNGGVWTRKAYTGLYGTYGFNLDGSNTFNDVSGNGQNFTGTNMDASNLDANDLPPYIVATVASSAGVSAPIAASSAIATSDLSAAGSASPVAATSSIASSALSAAGIAAPIANASAIAAASISAGGVATAIADSAFEQATPPVAPVESVNHTIIGGGGGSGMMSPELLAKELKRIERRQKRTPKTHVIKIGDWPEEVGFVEDDPLDMGEILSHQPARRAPSQQDSDDEEEAIMMLLTLAA